MWAHLVVIDPPVLDRLSGVVQSEEPVLIQVRFAELAVEAFDVAVLQQPSRSTEHAAADIPGGVDLRPAPASERAND